MFRESWLPKGFGFLSALPEQRRKERTLVPLQAFIDDSGGKGQGGYLVLAALVAKAEGWATFSDEWDRTIRAAPRIRRFKMSEAMNLKGEFNFVRPEARDEKVQQLLDLVDRFKPVLVYSCVDVGAFQDLFGSVVDVQGHSALGQPYLWAAMHLMYAVIHEEAKCVGGPDKIELIFDEHDIFKKEAKLQYEEMRKSNPHLHTVMPLEPWFRDDEDFMPLQAADLVAGVLRYGLNDELGKPSMPQFRFNLHASPRSHLFDRKELNRCMPLLRMAIAKLINEEKDSSA